MKPRFAVLVLTLILASTADGQDANGPVDLKVAQAAWDRRNARSLAPGHPYQGIDHPPQRVLTDEATSKDGPARPR